MRRFAALLAPYRRKRISRRNSHAGVLRQGIVVARMLIISHRTLIAIILLQLVHVICFGIVRAECDPIQCQNIVVGIHVNLLGKDSVLNGMTQRAVRELVRVNVVRQLRKSLRRVAAGIFILLLELVDVLQQILGGGVFLCVQWLLMWLVVAQCWCLGLCNGA